MPRTLTLLCALVCTLAPRLDAQDPARPREPAGFDFRPDGVWRPKSRAVMLRRRQALSARNLSQLNAAGGPGAATGVSAMMVGGVLRLPVLLVSFRNTVPGSLRDPSQYRNALASLGPAGRPYSLRTYYEEISNGLLSVRPDVAGWLTLDSNDTWYAGTGNGLTSSGHMGPLIANAVRLADAATDFGQYDNDGPDGVPNSGDDDGIVDILALVHPETGAECGPANGNIWAHRFRATSWGPIIATGDARAGGGVIRVDDYIIQSGIGGRTGCDDADLMGIGIMAHELGHGLDLPDFYDTNGNDTDRSQGIGHWGLMGSGNYRDAYSPAYMEGFSRLQLGWVSVRDVAVSSAVTLGAYPTGDSIIRIVPPVPNPRGEYYLLENRQGVLSDSVLVRDKAPGLLVWHVDPEQYAQGFHVNSGPIHALALEEADGRYNLRSSTNGISNRGDDGDPFPGSSVRRRFSFLGGPLPRLNSGGFAGFVLDSITQIVTGGEIRWRVTFGQLTSVLGSDSTALLYVRGQPYRGFRDLFADGDTATISTDAVQRSIDNRTELTFTSWSDGQPRTHLAALGTSGQTITANFSRRFVYDYGVVGAGSVAVSPALSSGALLAEGDSATLTASGDAGFSFLGWTGDTVTANPAITLRATRPWSVAAQFEGLITVGDSVLRPAVAGAPYADTLVVQGGAGTHAFALRPGAGSLPHGLQLAANGVITGTPARDSIYAFTVRVTSGLQTMDLALRMAVQAPAFTARAAVSQLLDGGSLLSENERRYLDLIGNNNGMFDVGDLTAWLDRSGQALSPPLMRRIMGRRNR